MRSVRFLPLQQFAVPPGVSVSKADRMRESAAAETRNRPSKLMIVLA